MAVVSAIEARTANGPEASGLEGPKSSQLKPAYDTGFFALSHIS